MSCEVAALPFQAHGNYVTWSIDFGINPIASNKYLLNFPNLDFECKHCVVCTTQTNYSRINIIAMIKMRNKFCYHFST